MPTPTSTLPTTMASTRPAFSDADIAQLLLTESRASNELWKTYQGPFGVAGYLNRAAHAGPPQASGLKTNKRFLKSVIRDATDHNRSLLARPARAISPDPRPQPALRPRRVDGSALERAVLGAGQRRSERDGPRERHHRKDRREGRSTEHGSSRRRRGSWHEADVTDRPSSSVPQHGRTRESDESHTAHCDASGSVAPVATSKMDKYFSPSYDPRLDINLDDATDAATGLVAGGNYEEWEAVLVQMRAKREEKSRAKEKRLEEKLARAQRKLARRERRRRRKEMEQDEGGESEGERRRRKRKRKERRGGSSSGSTRSGSDDSAASDAPRNHATHAQRAARKELGLMDIDGYAKRGKVREWDLGKQNPT